MGKLKDAAEATDNRMKALSETKIAQDIKKYTNQIWLAGLGAFSKADGEGNKYFDALVTAGKDIEERGREGVLRQVEFANNRVEDVKNDVIQKAEDVRDRANSTWDKVERVFDERVQSALTRLGIPSKADMDALKTEIAALKKNVDTLKKAKAPAKAATTAAKKAPAKKTTTEAAKKTTATTTRKRTTASKTTKTAATKAE
ncbi:phasin family protein [Litoribacillus peritrichatus]|uniref:Poly(Hydroxyalkanoate) granule-associated protein n=1 Tax=Litoribacillus peritrichatus TaxID=718191 RepID=A0ABP7MTH4_9GAMM